MSDELALWWGAIGVAPVFLAGGGTGATHRRPWEARPEAFEIVSVLSTGERGPAIPLLALFQAYDAAVSVIEDRDLTEAAQEARSEAEVEAERARWAR